MKTRKLFNGELEINDDEHSILCYLSNIDEEMLEFRLKKMAREIGWGGDMLVIANTAESELNQIKAGGNLQLARDWMNGKLEF